MLNYLALNGNLGNDPEIQFFGGTDDQLSVSFSLTFETGHDRTGRIRVTCFGSLAQLARRYLRQGSKVAVSGTLDQQEQELADGNQKNGLKLIARSVEIIGTDRSGNTAVTPLKPWLLGHRLSREKSADDLKKGSD